MNTKLDNRRDILLLLVYSSGITGHTNEPIIGRTRLVKMIYLFKTEVWKKFKSNSDLTDENMYEFFPWNYGPFSMEIYDDLTFFNLRGFIEINSTSQETLVESVEEWNFGMQKYAATNDESELNEYQEEEFRLTEKGINFSIGLFNNLSLNQQTILQEFKKRIQAMPLRALLRYVYKEYPEQTTKSIIKDDLLRH